MLMLSLHWSYHDQAYHTRVTEVSPVRIGRDPRCNIHDVAPTVSARHVEIFYYQGSFYVRNLKKANLVRVNNRVIEHSTRLKERDTIVLGGMTFVVASITDNKVGVCCSNCQNIIDISYADKECPICGYSLVHGTIVGLKEQ